MTTVKLDNKNQVLYVETPYGVVSIDIHATARPLPELIIAVSNVNPDKSKIYFCVEKNANYDLEVEEDEDL